MNPLDLFSPSYEVARRRFRDAARAAGTTVEQHRVDTGEAGVDFTIDVATVGAREPSWAVVVSSGVHGVEGFSSSPGCRARPAASLHPVAASWC